MTTVDVVQYFTTVMSKEDNLQEHFPTSGLDLMKSLIRWNMLVTIRDIYTKFIPPKYMPMMVRQ